MFTDYDKILVKKYICVPILLFLFSYYILVDSMAFNSNTGNGKEVKEKFPAIPTNLHTKIIKQLEFYFGDINLPLDYFLQREIKTDNGWVKINVLLRFKMLACISKNPLEIAAAVKNNSNSFLEVDEANKKIRRKPDNDIPIANEKFLNELIWHTIYCKGFPKTATMNQILEFAASFGDKVIIKVNPQKNRNKEFIGSLFFTFNTQEQAEHFLKQKSLKYNNIEIERTWEKDFN